MTCFNAIVQSGTPHRVIYSPAGYDIHLFQQNQRIARESVPALGAQTYRRKKTTALPAFQPRATVEPGAWQAQAKTVANVQPPPLEWLDLILQDLRTLRDRRRHLDRMAAEELKFEKRFWRKPACPADRARVQMLGRTRS